MARRKKKGSSRKRPLVFAESPIDESRCLPSPVFAARNPIGADVVSVKEKENEWVSPQIDPNAPCTPARRRRNRLNKAACSLDPSTQPTQRRREIAPKDSNRVPFTSLQFIGASRNRVNPGLGQASSCDTESSTDSDQQGEVCRPGSTGNRISPNGARRHGRPLHELGPASRTRNQQRRSQSSSNSSQECGKNLKKATTALRTSAEEGSLETNRPEIENRLGNLPAKLFNDRSSDSENISKNAHQRNMFLNESNHSRTSRERTAKGRKKVLSPEASLLVSSSSRETRDGRSCKSVKELDGHSGIVNPRPRHSTRTREAATRPGNVLEYDTPETDYGVRVSLRRRRKLLRTPARNKLLLHS